MSTPRFFVMILGVMLFAGLQTAEAQDYRVITHVYRTQDWDSTEKLGGVSRSLTIWHAGKAYDWITESGELIIYDPAQRRYTIMNGPLKKACTLEFSELRQFVKVAHEKAEDVLGELSSSNEPGVEEQISLIHFQLDPTFQIENQLEKASLISFNSDEMTYRVSTVPAPNKDVAEVFQKYADWSAQLNFVLHGQTSLPRARMAVNQELREQSHIPVKVQLSVPSRFEGVLNAEHKIHWNLRPQDRSRIQDGQAWLKDPQFQFISFQDYQKNLFR